jgi:hypothetical protein
MWESDIDAAILQSNYGIAPDDWSEERISAATNYIINHADNGELIQDLLPNNIDEDLKTLIPSVSQKLEIPSQNDINAMKELISDEEYKRLVTLRKIRDSAKSNRDNAIRAEQDAAYQASLEADCLKEIEKKNKAREEREARERQEFSAREELERPEREAREARERQEFLRAKRCQYFTATRN